MASGRGPWNSSVSSAESLSPAAYSRWRRGVGSAWPGVLLCAVVAIASAFISDHRGGPTLLYGLLLGMALNSVASQGTAKPGIDFTALLDKKFFKESPQNKLFHFFGIAGDASG